MVRKPRVEYPEAFTMSSAGAINGSIFGIDADRKHYLERLQYYRQRYGFRAVNKDSSPGRTKTTP